MTDLASRLLGSGTVIVTPEVGTQLFGYRGRLAPARTVSSDLEANYLVFAETSGQVRVLISLDALYGGDLTEMVARSLSLPNEAVTVMGSHTHYGAGIDSGISSLGVTDLNYLAMATERLSDAIRPLLRRRSDNPSTPQVDEVAHSAMPVSGLFVSRRHRSFGVGLPLPRLGRVVSAPGPTTVDHTLHVVDIRRNGRTEAILWGVGCHPVCFPDPLSISACYPGYVREILRRRLGRSVPILFAQGFSGDVRPKSSTRRPPPGAQAKLSWAAGGFRRFVDQTPGVYADWCASLARTAEAALQHACEDETPEVGVLRSSHYRAPSRPGWSRTPRICRLDFSEHISLLLVNAEVVSSRIGDLHDRAPDRVVIPAGCCDRVFGYWPTDQMRQQGGYEGRTSVHHFPPVDWAVYGGPDRLWSILMDDVLPKKPS